MATTYRKLSKPELRDRGLSEKSERYVSSDGSVISKRQFQKIQRGGLTYTAYRKQKGPRKVGPTTRAKRTKLHGGVFKSIYSNLTVQQAKTILARHKDKRAQIIVGIPQDYAGAERYKQTISEDGFSYRTSTPLSSSSLARKNFVDDIEAEMENSGMEVDEETMREIRITLVLYTYPKK